MNDQPRGIAKVAASVGDGMGSAASRGSGVLFVFEGPDGVGKSTLVSAASEKLVGDGVAAVAIALPGRKHGTLGAHVYALHHDPERFGVRRLSQESLQLLHVAAHIDAIENLIRPHIEGGEVVLLDRYWWSTWVYGVTGGVDRDALGAMIDLELRHWGSLRPDTVFLMERARPLRADDEEEFFLRRRAEYAALAERETASNSVVRVNAEKPVPEILKSVLAIIRERVVSLGLQSTSRQDEPR